MILLKKGLTENIQTLDNFIPKLKDSIIKKHNCFNCIEFCFKCPKAPLLKFDLWSNCQTHSLGCTIKPCPQNCTKYIPWNKKAINYRKAEETTDPLGKALPKTELPNGWDEKWSSIINEKKTSNTNKVDSAQNSGTGEK